MKFLPMACAVLLAIAPFSASAATPDFTALAGFIQKTKEATALPSGTAIAVVKDGRIIYEGYFGFADIAAKTPVTADTAFYVASATKPFFALDVLLQQAAGRVDTRTSLQQMFPEARFKGFDARAISLKDLLVHTSGIDNQPLVWATAFSGVHDAASLRALVAQSYPDDEAKHGTFKYTNVGYNIASVWLDRQRAMPWQEQLAQTVFQPLGMRHTSARISVAQAAGWTLAKPYSFANAQPREPLYLAKSDETMHAAGGVVASAPDIGRFLIAQLSGSGTAALSGDVIKQSQQPQVALSARYMDFPRTAYAWGWYVGEYKGRTMLHHFGGFAGFHAHLSFMPRENIGLVVLNNEDVLGAQLTGLIADYVYGSLLQEPGIEAKLASRFDALQGKAAGLRLAVATRREAIQARLWHLSRPRGDYAGTYANALLGEMDVRLNAQQQMQIRWGRLATVATGAEQTDHVRVEFAPGSGAFLNFVLERDAVEALRFEGMEFRKIR